MRHESLVLICGTSLVLTLAMPAPLAARSLLWIGATNGVPVSNWDLGLTPNWLDLANGTPTAYTQSPTAGDSVLFSDAASNGIVTLTTTLKPASVTVSNATLKYELGGAGTISGTSALIKQGSAALKLATPNYYSGGTSNLGGMLQVGNDSALGTGLLVFAGGNLSSDGTTARRLANNLMVTIAATLGNAANNGPLTFEGPIDLGGGARNLTINSPVIWSGQSSNGGINKLGSKTLTLTGAADWDATAEVRNGTLILDGAPFTNSAALRVDGSPTNGVARLVVTNGAVMILTGTASNFRAGYDGNTSATNILDIAGLLRIPNATAANGDLNLGRAGTRGFVNLWPGGDVEVRAVTSGGTDTPAAYSELNFRGGVLRSGNDTATFLQGLTNAYVRDGGAIIDTAGFDINIAQPLLNGGSGGLTKQGAGTLTLSGANTYIGGTLIQRGTLALGASERLADPGALTLDGPSAVFDLGGFSEAVGPVVLADGAIINGTLTGSSYAVTNGSIGAALAGAASLIKDGPGTVTLSGANTYPGISTIKAGKLVVTSAHAGSGALTVADGATLGLVPVTADTSLKLSELTLGESTGATAEINLAAWGSPAAPVVYATNLAAHGTVTLDVSGAGLAPGRFVLIQYEGNIGGAGFSAFRLGYLPRCIGAYLSNAPQAVELVITNITPLVWTGLTSSDWDFTTTNWQFAGIPAAYQEDDVVLFDDSAATMTVNLAVAANPLTVTVSNVTADYTFSGPGSISGGTGLNKMGGATLNLDGNNAFVGTTLVSAGTLAGDGALASPVVVDAGGVLAPGASIGRLMIRNTLTLSNGSATVMEINRTNAPLKSDRVTGVTTLTCGGMLTLVNTGEALAAGDTFQLLIAANRTGAFALTNLPPLDSGLCWNTTALERSGIIWVESTSPAPVQYVIQLSIDAMHADAPRALVNAGLGPNFHRLFTEGAWTEEARTDYRSTVTSPNHATEYTGRPIYDSTNALGQVLPGHLWGENKGDPWNTYDNTSFHDPHTFAQVKTNYSYVACVMDVAHDAGRRTGHFYNKNRLMMEEMSWDAIRGRLYPDLGRNDPGVAKIDFASYESSASHPRDHSPLAQVLMNTWAAQMAAKPFHYSFIHLDPPDHWGHYSTWDLTTSPMCDYMLSIQEVDGYLGQILAAITTNSALAGRTAIVLTADHGGILGTTGHGTVDHPDNFRVDFFVWGPGVPAGADLYDLNPHYVRPGTTNRPDYHAVGQPIRNGDAPNVGLHLLGLGPIPDSSLNYAQTLGVWDSDSDGLSDEYERLAGIDPFKADSDGDGMNDGAEVRAGTDPNASASVFAITGVEVSPAGSSVALSWSSVSNKVYALWGSTNLLEGFSLLSNNLPATPPINTYTDLAGAVMHKFYRVQVQP